jgi:hypothetical protein
MRACKERIVRVAEKYTALKHSEYPARIFFGQRAAFDCGHVLYHFIVKFSVKLIEPYICSECTSCLKSKSILFFLFFFILFSFFVLIICLCNFPYLAWILQIYAFLGMVAAQLIDVISKAGGGGGGVVFSQLQLLITCIFTNRGSVWKAADYHYMKKLGCVLVSTMETRIAYSLLSVNVENKHEWGH